MSLNSIIPYNPVNMNNIAPSKQPESQAAPAQPQPAKESAKEPEVEYYTVTTDNNSQSSQNTAQIKLAVSQSSGSMSAQQIADKYGISVAEAQNLLNELAKDSESGNSTFSLSV